MPRRARIVLPNVPLHLIQRGNNRQSCFFADEDYRNYLDWLAEYAGKTGCCIHAYVLMTNHVHLLVSSERGGASGEMMKALGQRYIELNLVRAGMIDRIRTATNGNFALGDNRFAEQVAATLGRRVVPGKPGRPTKAPEPESGSLF